MRVNICANGMAVNTFNVFATNSPENAYFCNQPAIDGLTYDTARKIEQQVQKFGKITLPASVAAGVLAMTQNALAANTPNLATKMQPIIHMVQDLALPVGITVSTWGLIEIMIGNPGGKQKIKYAVIGYIGIFLIPILFYMIRDGLGGQL